MRYIGCLAWCLVLTIIGLNMYPEVVITWAVAAIVAGLLDKRHQKRREQRIEMDRRVESKKEMIQSCKNRLEFSELVCEKFEMDKEKDMNVLLCRQLLDEYEVELKELEEKREIMKKTSFFKDYEM